MNNIILVEDMGENKVIAFFRSLEESAKFAEQNSGMAIVYRDYDGKLKDGDPLFWKSYLFLETNEVKTEQTNIYKFGSTHHPCRDGFTAFGRLISQELDYIVAWGSTEQEAINRVKAQAKEGRKNAARTKAWKACIQPFEDEASSSGKWDPYQGWLTKEQSQKCKEISEKAYEETE